MSAPAADTAQAKTLATRAIFISYRRNDSEGEAGRLFDDLARHFGEDSVFMDVTAIEPGRDFRKAIDESVASCGVLLAMISGSWVDAKNDAGLRRLDDPADFVRLETASALRRDIPVIPVLVRGVKMPRSEQLPDDLKDLAYRNGVELTHARWASDLQLLIKALEAALGPPRRAGTPPSGDHAADGASLVDRPPEKNTHERPDRPLWGRVLALSWRKRLLFFALALALGAGIPFHSTVGEGFRRLFVLFRVTSAQNNKIPLSASELAILDSAITTLAASLSSDLSNPDRSGIEAWPLAQVVLAEHGLVVTDGEALRAFFFRTSVAGCSCWREFASSDLPPNIPATGWVLTALASLNIPADPTVRFLLQEQNPEGWWSVFPVNDNSRYASVYGTSWAILGLNSQLQKRLISGNEVATSTEAIRRGATWLLNHREPNSARWRSYPLADGRIVAESLSGLAVHALHQILPDASSDLSRQWLEGLPSQIPSVDAADSVALYDIRTRAGMHNDHYVQIRLPWLLIATTDAYRDANPALRISAIRWLERALRETGIRGSEVTQQNWWRAELLFALRYLRSAAT